MENRKVRFYAQLHIFRKGDLICCEREYLFLGDEDEFAEGVEEKLFEWLKDLKKFGLKEYGWKYPIT